MQLKRRWDDDTVFKNQSRNQPKGKKRWDWIQLRGKGGMRYCLGSSTMQSAVISIGSSSTGIYYSQPLSHCNVP